jgi:hypothetical protein
MSQKEVFNLWKELNPLDAFSFGLKEYAGKLWIPSHHNTKQALHKIDKLIKKSDESTKAFLHSIRIGLLIDEPHDPPGTVLSAFFAHLVVEGINNKHLLTLSEACLQVLQSQKDLQHKEWPAELQIFTAQNCDGAISILDTIKKKTNRETTEAITSLQKQIKQWKEKICKIKVNGHDYKTISKLIKNSKGIRRPLYRKILSDKYGYLESAEEIEQLATKWLLEEVKLFKKIQKKLATRYKCKQSVPEIEKRIEKEFYVSPKKLVSTINNLRKILEPIANKNWVKINKGYTVKVIETPPYLAPMLPTAAMQPFNGLKKPFNIFFATTDTKASPSTALPDVAQTLIHEEYGHCVNFHNSYTKRKKLTDILTSGLDIPITEGISFNREQEALTTLRKKPDARLKKEIEKWAPYENFVDAFEYTVRQWRLVRFLRAISDSRLNRGKQTLSQFIDWAHKITELEKDLIFHQTFHFQENPGYAPCYSIFGQRIRTMQTKLKNIVPLNTYLASRGFPPRKILEKELKQKFNL